MKIIYTTKFLREYKKLPLSVKKVAEETEEVFRKDPFESSLKTHKLHGKLKDFWSFSVGYKYRIIFELADDDLVYFYSVGSHDVYQ